MGNYNATALTLAMNKKIAYITDIHLDEQFPMDYQVDTRKNWEMLLNDISSRNIEDIIFGGDIGEKSANNWFFDSLRDFNIAITLGNHDHFDEVIQFYDFANVGKQTELYYSQEFSFYKFIFLDSSSGSIGQQQFDWLKNELLTTKNIVLFIHHPILSIDAEVDKRFALHQRDRIQTELLKIENKIHIFSGHYHFDDVRNNANIRQYVTPASSYQVEKIPDTIEINNSTFGYRIIELNEHRIDTDLVMFKNT